MSMPSSKFSLFFFIFFITAALTGCQKFEKSEVNVQSTDDIVRLQKNEVSLGIYKSSITQVDEYNKQAWLNMPNSNVDNKIPLERLSEMLIQVNCRYRSFKFIKTTDKNGKDLQLGVSDWEIPAPTDTFYPVVQYLCPNSLS